MKSLKEIESVGWLFFIAMYAVVIGPTLALIWKYTYEMETSTRVWVGIFLAAIVAAVITWAINEALHLRNVRRHERERHQERKQKKRKK